MLIPSKPPRTWRIIAEEVCNEHDGQRMTELMRELLQALEHDNEPTGAELRENLKSA